MNQTKRVRPLRHRGSRDQAPERDRGPASTRGRRAAVLVGGLGLLLAFAGSATAGSLITGKRIKDSTITSVDLRDGRLRGVDIRDGSLAPTDFGRLPAGAPGPQGGPGPAGPDGVQGVSRPHASSDVAPFGEADLTVDCPAGSHVVGGGLSNDPRPQDLYIVASYPATDGWVIRARNLDGSRFSTVTAVAVCVQ